MRLLVLPGDGIGPEITDATLRVLEVVDQRFHLDLQVERVDIGFAALGMHGMHGMHGTTLPDTVLERVPQVDGTLLGPVSHYDYPPAADGGINPSAVLRTCFRLFANIRPAQSIPGLSVLREPLDVVIVRENTEGFYADRNMYAGTGEFMTDADTALSLRKVTAEASRAVAEEAFALAEARRGHVTAVHKANVLKLGDGLFLREVRAVAERHPHIELRELIVDAAAARLIRDPASFDVLVTTNMFGDILSDEATELAGSLGIGGSISVGSGVCVGQAQHGSAPDIAGHGVANPVSLIASAAMVLRWHGTRVDSASHVAAADAIDAAVGRVVANPASRTRDLGGSLGTREFTDVLIAALATPAGASQAGPAAPAAPAARNGKARTTDEPTPPSLLVRPGRVAPFDRGNGVVTIPYVGTWNCETNRVTTGQTRFEPGTGLPLHSHNVEESVLVLEGVALAEIGNESLELTAGDATWVPAGVPHRFANRGAGPMRIYWVYGGRHVTRTMTATGETFEHLSDSDRGGASTR